MKYIGDRISWSEKDGDTFISVSGRVESWKETLLAAWLLAWTFCGAYIISQLFGEYDREMKLTLVVYLFFWGYFEYKIGRAFFWRKWGYEMLKISNESIMIKNDIRSYGKVVVYFFENIKDMSLIEYGPRSFLKSYNESFWVIGGDSITFKYLGKKVAFGKQLDGSEARKLLKLIEERIRKKSEPS